VTLAKGKNTLALWPVSVQIRMSPSSGTIGVWVFVDEDTKAFEV